VKYYTITGYTNSDGSVTPLNRSSVPESSLNSLKKFHARYGDKLEYVYSNTLSDQPLYRHPTDEERADGVRDLILND
jgi:hypothetical protein